MFKTEAEEEAEELIERIKTLLASQDGLIYSIDKAEVKKSNVISPSTIGDRDAWVFVTLYNVSNPDKLFERRTWMKLGEMGVDVDTHGSTEIEFYKKFKG